MRSSRSVPTTQASGGGGSVRPVDVVAPGGPLQHAR